MATPFSQSNHAHQIAKRIAHYARHKGVSADKIKDHKSQLDAGFFTPGSESHAVCDVVLAVCIGTGLAWVLQQWWFAP